MNKKSFTALCLVLLLLGSAMAQDTNLNRAEVGVIKNKLVAVKQALGGDPDGYALDTEEYDLPTNFSSAGKGKYWALTSNVYLNYTDKALKDFEANSEQAAADAQAQYMAAVMSGNQAAMQAAMAGMMQAGTPGEAKEDLSVNVQFNMNPMAGIDPDGVLFEKPGVIALKDYDVANSSGQLVVYFDPVKLRETETLSQVDLSLPQGGVSNRTGVFNIQVTLRGPVASIEALAQRMDTGAVLSLIDSL
ncbi:MAG: hypothetical protein OEW64_11895 [Gammaproteobacteria bacterium]|nr:hypothetical protein [Gammaproteobacteria bacterium]MDH5304782.1 hypothetical protein [Gammaproteobacteria bacterium]MDH5323060.1 hypothetical protein [Gammaproteobacteria bacterium]